MKHCPSSIYISVLSLCGVIDYIINFDYIIRHNITNKNMQVEFSYEKIICFLAKLEK